MFSFSSKYISENEKMTKAFVEAIRIYAPNVSVIRKTQASSDFIFRKLITISFIFMENMFSEMNDWTRPSCG